MNQELFAIYLRKSRKDLELKEYDVLERHRRILLDFANSRNIPINKEDIYEEVVSGETIQDRPVVQQLLKKIEAGYYKAVLVMEIERLARGNTIDQGIIAQTFQLTNTLIITPNKTYDTNNEYDNEFLEFGLFMSRREYKAITRRIQAGRIQSVKEGNFIGSVTPYGYDKEKLIKRYSGFVQKASQRSTETEIRAMNIERNCEDCYKAEYMQQHIGEIFKGLISSVTEYGFYVELENTVEGLVHVNSLPEGNYIYDGFFSLTEEFSNTVYSVGTKVSVLCAGADVNSGKIDFNITDNKE